MELPHGVLVRSFRGPIPLAELNSALLKDSFTGLMRASLLKGTIVEGVIIYDTGKPVIAFTSDSRKDSPDNDQKANASVAASDDTVIELFALNEGQLRLAMDFGRDFLINLPPPPPVKAVEAPRPMPVQRPKAEKPLSFPEVRGTFAKSESTGSLRSYIETRKDETGHAVIIGQDGAQEYHLLLLQGKVIAAYSAASKEAGAALLNNIMHVSGVAEFYRVDEAIVHSILRMYPHVGVSFKKPSEPLTLSSVTPMNEPVRVETWQARASRLEERADAAARPAAQEALRATEKPGPMETHRYDTIPRQGIGVPAKSLFDRRDRSKVEGMGMPAPESKSTGTLKGDMDDDADFVKKVEKEFVGNVDDLLKRLELSHLKVVPDKKKRL
jgi:hypothetical protein